MNYSTIKKHDIANGLGIRISIFVTGCTHRCEGCFNSEIWDFNSGTAFTQDTIDEILEALAPRHIKGLSLLGGEPFESQNQETILELLRAVREKYPNKDVWAYSGYTFEDMLHGVFRGNMTTLEILSLIDILVDGKFVIGQRDLTLRFRGSANQRIINVPESLEDGKVHLVDFVENKPQPALV